MNDLDVPVALRISGQLEEEEEELPNLSFEIQVGPIPVSCDDDSERTLLDSIHLLLGSPSRITSSPHPVRT